MDQNSSLFSLSIDVNSKEPLAEAARWARFLAIVGFVFLGFLIIAGIAFSSAFSRLGRVTEPALPSTAYGIGYGLGTALVYLAMALIYLFPLLYLLRFANAARTALASNDQELLMQCFLNLKRFLRYAGILTIVGLGFLVLSVVIAVAGFALMSR